MKSLLTLLLTEGIELPTGEDFISKVIPNLWAFLCQLLAFIVMVIIVIKFAYKPIHEFIEKRKAYIKENLESAASKNLEATSNLEQTKLKLQESEAQAIEIIAQAKIEASKIQEEMIEAARKEIIVKKNQASEDIKLEKEKALKELHDEVIDIALQATETILDREINKKDDAKLIDNFVNELTDK